MIFVTGLNPFTDNLSYLLQSQVAKIDNLRYFCNFSSFSFYYSEDEFQVHDYQILFFFYVIKVKSPFNKVLALKAKY